MKPRSQLFIDKIEVDLFDDIPVPLNLSVVDIREPQKRKGSWSKTVTIPGSKINNKLFTNFFDVNLSVQAREATVPILSGGEKAGTVFASDDEVGTESWRDPENAARSDNTHAVARLGTGEQSHYLKATGFGFDIPDTAKIVGIELKLERKGDSINGNFIDDNIIKLVKRDTVGGQNKATTSKWGVSDTTIIYGSNSNLWGLTWTPSDINASDFGLVASAKQGGTGTSEASIDYVALIVYYNEFGGNFSPDFNPNLKADTIYYIDKVEQFAGIAQLTDVRIVDDKIEYDLVLKGRLADIFINLGDSELTDLDLSEFDHAYSKLNQKASWDTSIVEDGAGVPFELGKGYVYPMIDYGFTDGTKYSVRHFFPAIYLKQYIDKLFEFAGFTFTSNFLDSTYFKRFIIPFNSDRFGLTATQILDRSFRASRLTTDYETANIPEKPNFLEETIIFNDDSTGANFDTQDVYDTSNGDYTINGAGNYEVSIELDVTIDWGVVASGNRLIIVDIVLEKDFGGSIGLLVTSKRLSFFTNDITAHESPVTKVILKGTVANMGIGNKVRVVIQAQQRFATHPNYTATAKVKVGSVFFNRVINNGLTEGDIVVLNNAIPRKIKLKDFFIWVIKAFNLYLEPDKEDSKKLHVEPRDDWYASGTTVDWSDKLSKDRETIYKPMGELTFRKLIMTYAEDKDYFNTIYKDVHDRIYGDREIDIANDFLTETLTNKVGFAPTPLTQLSGIDRFVSRIISIDKNGLIKPFKSKIRMLYYGGVKTTNAGWLYESLVEGNEVQTTYPYAGHLDDPDIPREDLSFGVPREVFYRAFSYTNNNLYNKYHKKMIEEITDPNAKMVIAWFNLNPTDILTLDFRDKFFFEGQFYRINRVIDYNPLINGLTKCEFIKIIEGVPFVPENPDMVGGIDETLGADAHLEDAPIINYPDYTAENILADIGQRIISFGEGNAVGAGTTGFIAGNRNVVGDNVSGVTMFGASGNTVFGGLSNISLINTSGVTVSGSNKHYVDNVDTEFLIKSVGSVAGAEDDITAPSP